MYPIRFGTKSATCTIFAAWRGVGWCKCLLVQQLVLAAAAAVGKERLRYCNVGLSQRCGGEFFTRSYAATGVQLRCKLGAAALCLWHGAPGAPGLQEEPSPVPGRRPKTYRGLAERKPSEEQRLPSKLSASRITLSQLPAAWTQPLGTGRAATTHTGHSALPHHRVRNARQGQPHKQQ